MNWAHVHLIGNHVAVLGVFFGLLLLLAALARKSSELKKAALAVFFVTALLAVPVYLTGEPAEEVVEHLPGVSHELIEEHEESALPLLIALELLGLLSLAGLWFFRRSPGWASRIVLWCLLLSVIVAGMAGWTANLGGQIRHSEVRSDFQPPPDED